MRLMIICRPTVAFCATVLFGRVLAQTPPDEPTKSIHISGRLVSPDRRPVSFPVRMTRIDADGPKSDETVTTGPDGLFTFKAAPGKRYRIALAAGMMKTPPKIVDTTNGKDVDVGDMLFEYCPPVTMHIPKPPTAPKLVGKLRLEQIVVEPQNPASGWPGVRPMSGLPPTNFNSSNAVGLPPCWVGPSLDRRSEWESLCDIMFDRYLSIESFVGGNVNFIRVVRHDPKLTPAQIKDEVRKVWLGLFWHAACEIMWAEGNFWNIEASVEYEDGKRASILMDGWTHVEVENREGKQWFIRLWPAVD